VIHACNPSFSGGGYQEALVQSQPWQIVQNRFFPLSQKNPSLKKGWQTDSSGKSACLASARPGVQTPILPIKEKPKLLFYD
jgi:hypothetical protein